MRRGEIYRVIHPPGDPRNARVFVVASRDRFLAANYASATCVPVYTNMQGLETEVRVDESNGLKHASAARCDELQRVLRRDLRIYVGVLSRTQMTELSRALAAALGISGRELNDL